MRTLTTSRAVERWMVRSVFATLALCAAGPALAQTQTRTELLAAERDKKAVEIVPPQRSFVERTLNWYDNQSVLPKVFGGWHGFHLAGADFPAGAGTKVALGFDEGIGLSPSRSTNRIEVTGVAARSTRGYTRYGGGLGISRLGGAALDVRARVQRYEYPEEDFFGFGPDSDRQRRSNYLLRSREVAGEIAWRPFAKLQLGAGVARLRPETTDGHDPRFPSVQREFDRASLPGFGASTEFIRTDARAAIELRDNPLHPHAGGFYSIAFSSFNDRDATTYDFDQVAVDVQQYVPLPNRYRTLALRASAVVTDPRQGGQVPFFYQPTLGGAQALRGFRESRFRDTNSLVVSAEYRWEAWWALDGAFFVDAGQVAPNRSSFSIDQMEVSYGVGFRLHSNGAFISRLDLAFSREGFIPLLRFEHAF